MKMIERTIHSIVPLITKEIKETSESQLFYDEVKNVVSYQLTVKQFDNVIESEEFIIETINDCIKQMVKNIMGSYVLRTCKPIEKINDKEILVIKDKKG